MVNGKTQTHDALEAIIGRNFGSSYLAAFAAIFFHTDTLSLWEIVSYLVPNTYLQHDRTNGSICV